MLELDELEVLLVLDDALAPPAPDGGGPPGPPAPPGPLAKVVEKRFLSSVAWELVSLPLETSLEIRSLIFDCSWSGDGGELLVLLLELLDWLLRAESMSLSADDNAVASVELILPEETSDCSSF